MNESPVTIQLANILPANPENGDVPAEHYLIVEKRSQKKAGAIRLRLSNREDILLYAGHIG